jgi:hypothetical protein
LLSPSESEQLPPGEDGSGDLVSANAAPESLLQRILGRSMLLALVAFGTQAQATGRSEPSGREPLGGADVRANRAGQYLAFLCSRRIRVQGPAPGPGNDTSNLGVYYGKLGDDLPDQSSETVVEVNHRSQLAPWLYVMPDFQ